MSPRPPLTPAGHIDQAKRDVAAGLYHTAEAHALIAIAELLAAHSAASNANPSTSSHGR